MNSAECLDRGTAALSNHMSVISRSTCRFRCGRPWFDQMFE